MYICLLLSYMLDFMISATGNEVSYHPFFGHHTEKKKKYSGGGMKYTAMASMAYRAT